MSIKNSEENHTYRRIRRHERYFIGKAFPPTHEKWECSLFFYIFHFDFQQ